MDNAWLMDTQNDMARSSHSLQPINPSYCSSPMKIGIIIGKQTKAEKAWNGLRFGNAASKRGHDVKTSFS